MKTFYTIVLLALFEYFFQVPANRIGFRENGGPFTLFLRVKQIFSIYKIVSFYYEIPTCVGDPVPTKVGKSDYDIPLRLAP